MVITKSGKSHKIVKLEVENFEHLGCKVWLNNQDKYILKILALLKITS